MLRDRGGAELRARFLREARLASAIVHPNIATIYEVGGDADIDYIAMELVRGKTLREALPQLRASRNDLIHVAKGIARGLEAAHARGIVHRDLKPENVILDDVSHAPKILDFGLAKFHSAPRSSNHQHHSTEDGRILGTPAYMSPEQAAGKALDARSDLFSFGVILYEGLSGARPFQGDTSHEVLAAVMRDTPAPIRKIAPDVPKPLAELVHRCLAKDPNERPANVKEILEAFDAPPPRRSSARTRSIIVAAALLVTAIAVYVARGAAPAASVVRHEASGDPSSLPPPPSTASAIAASSAAVHRQRTTSRCITNNPARQATTCQCSVVIRLRQAEARSTRRAGLNG